MVDRLEPKGRRICVVSMPGDRRNEDVLEATTILAEHFDHFICKADDNRRRRGHDEIPQLLRTGLLDQGVDNSAIEVIPEETEAVDRALNMAEPEDLVVILGDAVTRCWKQIINFNIEEGSSVTKETSMVPPSEEQRQAVIQEYTPPVGMALIQDHRGVRISTEEDD